MRPGRCVDGVPDGFSTKAHLPATWSDPSPASPPAFAAVCTFASSAPAFAFIGAGFERAIAPAGVAFELAIPDLRLELSPLGVGPTLSWPVHWRVYELKGQSRHYAGHDSRTDSFPRLELTVFLEPQLAFLPTGPIGWRGLGGVRGVFAADTGVSLIAEGGGLVGSDGHGAFAGAGVGWTFNMWRLYPLLALVVRESFTTTGLRTDLALDFVITLPLRDL